MIVALNEQFQNDDFNEFQLAFMCNFIGRGINPQYRTNAPMRHFETALKIRLGPQDYGTISGQDALRLSHFDTVRGHRRDDKADGKLLPKYHQGMNEGILRDFAEPWFRGQLVDTAGDGTRTSRWWARVLDKMLGHEENPDCELWGQAEFYVPEHKWQFQLMMWIVRKLGMLSSEVHTEQLRCTTSRKAPLAYCILPEASKGNTGFLTFKYWMMLLKACRRNRVTLKDFITDMCSTGLLGARLLMTPCAENIRLGCSFLGVPTDDYKYFAIFCEPDLKDGCEPLSHAWIPEIAHLCRLLQRNLDNLSFLPFFSPKLDNLEMSEVASLGNLKRLSSERANSKLSLKHVGLISDFANFNNDSAFYMVSMSTIDIISNEFPQEKATRLALVSFHFLMCVYRDPNFTNPILAVEYVWRCAEVWRLQEVYVKEVLKMDSPSDCLPSYQFREAVEMAACGATNHFLGFHRKRRTMKLSWEQCAMNEKNGDMLEGLHSQGRHQKNGSIDVNFSFKEWLEIMDDIGDYNIAKNFLEKLGLKFGAPSNTQKTSRGEYHLGHYPSEGAEAKCVYSQMPADVYADFLADVTAAREAGKLWARNEWERVFGVLAINQFQDAGMWDERVKVREDEVLLGSRLLRFNETLSQRAREDLEVVAVELPHRETHGYDKLQGFSIVLDDSMPVLPQEDIALSAWEVPEKVLKKQREIQKNLQDLARRLMDDVDIDDEDDEQYDDLLSRLQTLQAEAKSYRESLKSSWQAKGEGSQQSNRKRKKRGQSLTWQGKSIVKSEHDQVAFVINDVLAGRILKDVGEDGVVRWVSTDKVARLFQKRERVNKERGLRFVKGRLPEWHIACRDGHDVCLGVCLLVKWGGAKHFAAVRVLSIRNDENQKVHSVKLNRKSKKQQYRVEVLTPCGATEAGSQRYKSSGWQIGPISGVLIHNIVELVPLQYVEGAAYNVRIDEAILPVLKVEELKQRGFTQIVADHEGNLVKLPPGLDTPTRLKGWSRYLRCYFCKCGWYDHKTGAIVKCSQGCNRAFHQSCCIPAISNNVDFTTWVCAVCAGRDKEVCAKCGEGFNEKECEDPTSLENNELVCCGKCERWWHQACHVPCLYPLPVGDWLCSDCAEADPKADKANGEPAAAQPTSQKKAKPKKPASKPPTAPTRKYPRRSNANYGPGPSESDGWTRAEMMGLDAARATRSGNLTWTRVN